MDAANSFFPMDLGAMPMQTDSINGLPTEAQASPQQGGQTNPFSGNAAAFMGVSVLPSFLKIGSNHE
jgi:hypothetical protein